jgi:hypothetical protein
MKMLTHPLKTEHIVSISTHQNVPTSDLLLAGEERGIDSNYFRDIRGNFHENPSIGPDF